MRFRRKMYVFLCICLLALAGLTMRVYASPSISDFHDREPVVEEPKDKNETVADNEQEPEAAKQTNQVTIAPNSTDGTNTSGILSESGIYTNEAISDQYKETDENGNLVATDMSRMIDTAAATLSETDENGKSIVDDIPTVTEILNNINPDEDKDYEKEYGYDPDKLDQLTYILDFKYVSTDYRVIAGEKVHVGNKTEILDNGMIRVSIKGGEILRSASIDDYVIIQVDPINKKMYFIKMKEYDEKTGDYIADFPCVGPYMVTQIMDR